MTNGFIIPFKRFPDIRVKLYIVVIKYNIQPLVNFSRATGVFPRLYFVIILFLSRTGINCFGGGFVLVLTVDRLASRLPKFIAVVILHTVVLPTVSIWIVHEWLTACGAYLSGG